MNTKPKVISAYTTTRTEREVKKMLLLKVFEAL